MHPSHTWITLIISQALSQQTLSSHHAFTISREWLWLFLSDAINQRMQYRLIEAFFIYHLQLISRYYTTLIHYGSAVSFQIVPNISCTAYTAICDHMCCPCLVSAWNKLPHPWEYVRRSETFLNFTEQSIRMVELTITLYTGLQHIKKHSLFTIQNCRHHYTPNSVFSSQEGMVHQLNNRTVYMYTL